MIKIKILLSLLILSFCSCGNTTKNKDGEYVSNYTVETQNKQWKNVRKICWNYASGTVEFTTDKNKNIVLINKEVLIRED